MDEFLSKMSGAVDRIGAMLANKAPEAAELVVNVVHLKAILSLVIGGSVAIALGIAAYKLIRKGIEFAGEPNDVDAGFFIFVVGAIAGVLAVIATVVFLSPANWLGAIDGRYGLAYRIMEKLL